MRSIFQYLIAAAVLIASVFMAFWLFVAFVAVAVFLFAYISAKRWWLRQQMDKVEPSPEEPSHGTIIEGQFETVEPLPESQEPRT